MSQTHAAGGLSTSGDSGGGFHARLPDTSLGKWSMWIAVAFVAMFAINMVLVGVFGTTTNAAYNAFSSTYLPYYVIAMLGAGVTAGIVGVVAMLMQKERSVVTLLAVLPALFVIFLLVGEFAVPH